MLDKGLVSSIGLFNWPLTGLVTSPTILAELERTYLNVARPPYQKDETKSAESMTYVPLPLHIHSLFSQVVQDAEEHINSSNSGHNHHGGSNSSKNTNRQLHIGANVNPLSQDPFRMVLLNPGCLTSIMRLPASVKPPKNAAGGVREPLNKMATSINQLLRIGASDSLDLAQHFLLLPSHVDTDQGGSRKTPKDSPFSHLIEFNLKHYKAQLSSPTTPKFLVSANVNVLNVFALNETFDYNNTTTFTSTASPFPLLLNQLNNYPPASSADSVTSSCSQVSAYTKMVEKPVLRLQLKNSIVVTSIVTLSSEASVVLGLNTGDIVYLNLSNLSYRIFSVLGTGSQNLDLNLVAIFDPVTSLNAIIHPTRSLLLVAGFSSGEVLIIDPIAPGYSASAPYRKKVVGKDRFVTFFKRFDLSFAEEKGTLDKDDIGATYVVGHFKLSLKPITCIASTIAHDARIHFPNNPMILAFASEDGLVRFIDLIATHGQNYGNLSNFYNLLILTDMISCYFQDGLRFIQFSPDFRFLCVCGAGDSIEIFKMSYYNVNGLLLKNSEAEKKAYRSRSNTVTSVSSNAHSLSIFSPPISSNTSQNCDSQKEDSHELKYPPIIKDIVIVSRFKAHTNIIERVAFVKADEFHHTKSKTGHEVYNFISCGRDGQVMVWELNTKALTKTKKAHLSTVNRHQSVVSERRMDRNPSLLTENTTGSQSAAVRGKHLGLPSSKKHHQRNRSITSHEDNILTHSFSALGINNILGSNTPPPTQNDNSEEQNNIVNSLYKSLYEFRLKKHYGKQEIKNKYQCIIHGVVDDLELPIMRIPLLVMDLSCLIREGSINGFHLASNDFWVFSSAGDIFRYKIV